MPRGTEACAQSENTAQYADTLNSATISVRERFKEVKQGFAAYSQLYAHCFQWHGMEFECLSNDDMCSTLSIITPRGLR